MEKTTVSQAASSHIAPFPPLLVPPMLSEKPAKLPCATSTYSAKQAGLAKNYCWNCLREMNFFRLKEAKEQSDYHLGCRVYGREQPPAQRKDQQLWHAWNKNCLSWHSWSQERTFVHGLSKHSAFQNGLCFHLQQSKGTTGSPKEFCSL